MLSDLHSKSYLPWLVQDGFAFEASTPQIGGWSGLSRPCMPEYASSDRMGMHEPAGMQPGTAPERLAIGGNQTSSDEIFNIYCLFPPPSMATSRPKACLRLVEACSYSAALLARQGNHSFAIVDPATNSVRHDHLKYAHLMPHNQLGMFTTFEVAT